jgi:hypothetical protein
MKKPYALLLLSLCAVPAFADAPLTGIDRLVALLPGTWKTTGQTLDSAYTKAGKVDYVAMRDCWREAAELKCVYVVNQRLQLLSIFSWDAQDGIYHENQITVSGPSPAYTIMVKGDVWTYTQELEDKEGKVHHSRKVRDYSHPGTVSFTGEYSEDGKTWVTYEQGTETKID